MAKQSNKHGFTLLEVMVVVLIGVLITMASVPVYKKNQDRNRYLAASGVLMELGNAMILLRVDYPKQGLTSEGCDYCFGVISVENSSVNGNISANGPVNPQTFVGWLQTVGYLSKFPSSTGTYKGYSYKVKTHPNASTGVSCCSTDHPSEKNWYACMSGANSISDYTCAWVDRWGELHHN